MGACKFLRPIVVILIVKIIVAGALIPYRTARTETDKNGIDTQTSPVTAEHKSTNTEELVTTTATFNDYNMMSVLLSQKADTDKNTKLEEQNEKTFKNALEKEFFKDDISKNNLVVITEGTLFNVFQENWSNDPNRTTSLRQLAEASGDIIDVELEIDYRTEDSLED